MGGRHLPDGTLRAFVAGQLAEPRERGVSAHLAVCEGCRRRCLDLPGGRALLEDVFGADLLGPDLGPLAPGEAAQLLLSRRCLVELEESDPRDWALIAEHDLRFAPLPVVAMLLARAESEYHRDLECAEGASAAAVAALERWQLASTPPPKAEAVAARGWATRANVLRLQSRFREADGAVQRAEGWLAKCPSVPQVEGWVKEVGAVLLRERGAHREALKLFRYAGYCYGLAPDESSRLRCLAQQAFCHSDAGRPGEAASIFESILPRLRKDSHSPRLRMVVSINLAIAYTRLNRTWEARRLLPEIERLMAEVGEPLSTVRLSWLRAMIHHQDGKPAKAEHYYRQVQAEFLEAGVPQDAALVSLDLAVLLLETDQPAKAAELATEVLPIFSDLGIPRETLAAGLVLLEALERQEATIDAVRNLAQKIRTPAWSLG